MVIITPGNKIDHIQHLNHRMKLHILIKLFQPVTAVVIVFLFALTVSGNDGCYTIVVGKDASVDGSVIMAHNEDDSPPQVVNHLKVPRKKYPPGSKIEIARGDWSTQIDQVAETYAYLWSEMPGTLFSDSFVNEWGVCITSNSCPSQIGHPWELTGGIAMRLRRTVAQRARSAREGVHIAAQLVKGLGYGASGRTYIISDPHEGWLFAVTRGRHWAAARVPDDEVAMIANTYTIHNVDLSDTLNFRGSADIIDYATERGWYNPDEDGEFDFAAAYANPEVASNPSNYCRQWAALNHVTMTDIQISENLPFSVKPKEKLDVEDIMEILRDHYEGTDLETEAFELGNPHDWNVSTICGRATQTSFVVQLRGEMPADIGIVYWVSLAPPCGSVYIPFYFGITDFPGGYNTQESKPSAAYFNEKIQAPFEVNKSEAFWTFSNFFYKTDGNYSEKMPLVSEEFGQIEKRILAQQDSLEKVALDRYPHDKEGVQIMLTEYSNRKYREVLEVMERINISISR